MDDVEQNFENSNGLGIDLYKYVLQSRLNSILSSSLKQRLVVNILHATTARHDPYHIPQFTQ